MVTINGTYTSAVVFTTGNAETAIDGYAVAQLEMICSREASAGCRIRVMPDVHPGNAGPVGLTMTVGNKVMPGLIGTDIGCGMTLARIQGKVSEFQKLDSVIRECVPAGSAARKKMHRFSEKADLSGLRCFSHIDAERTMMSLGSLGGGNHFIEIDRDDDGNFYAVIHSGSRHLGKEVSEYYLREGRKKLKQKGSVCGGACGLNSGKAEPGGKRDGAEHNGAKYEYAGAEVPYELTWLEGSLMEDYLHDLQIVQRFASLNRAAILDELVKGMKWKVRDSYECIHNYVDADAYTLEKFHAPMLRKGAISAKEGEKVIIPANMRDGIILGTGRGNEEWNLSAPHGAGRIMNRENARNGFTVSEFKAQMKGIYSSCIGRGTLDEAPFAYRKLEEIAEAIGETVTIDRIIRPVYNFKAGENVDRDILKTQKGKLNDSTVKFGAGAGRVRACSGQTV